MPSKNKTFEPETERSRSEDGQPPLSGEKTPGIQKPYAAGEDRLNLLYHSIFQWGWKHFPSLRKYMAHRRLLPWKSVICDGPGFRLRIRPPRTSVIGSSVYLSGIWEPEMTAAVQQNVQNGWHVLDVGADIGYYSLLFASRCGPQGAVAAFEPDPEPWPILLENIAMFDYPIIRPFPLALSDHRGHGMMKRAGRGQMFPDREKEGTDTSTVEMLPLGDVWPRLAWDRLDLVKIDVEGAEMSVLRGMEKILEEYRPQLVIEIHPYQLREVFHSSAEEVISFLTEKYPYRLTPIAAETLDIPQKGNLTVWCVWVDGDAREDQP